MPGLLLIVTQAKGERFEAALELAAAAAALGRPVAVLLRGPAVLAVRRAGRVRAFDLLFELGARVSLCQTAMAAHGVTAADLPTGVAATGLVALLAGRADWQLAIV
jgi:intracellular sulfur oxidation DsrE/DsrF family protein